MFVAANVGLRHCLFPPALSAFEKAKVFEEVAIDRLGCKLLL